MMLQPQPISYRNGLYQGSFSSQTNSRSGFGLAFTTDNHLTIGSTWNQNQINDATFIYYNHAHYVYGFWKMSMPHGFNAVKMGHCVIFAWYQRGVLQGRFLVFYEQYDTVVVLEKRRGDPDGEFIEIQKGDVFSDQDLNQYIQLCNWPQFQQSWKTLIKFLSTNMTSQQNKFQPKLQLLNHTYYRYGYSQGLAIIFDDDYNIISAGLHNKANLKSLGIKFTKQNFVEEGNFNNQNQIYAFNYGNRPEIKIGKLYNQYLLKSVEFVNQFISNPAQLLIQYMEGIVNSNLMRKVMAGQITNRKIQGLGSPQGTDRSRQSRQSKHITSGKRQKEETPRLQEYRDIKKEEQKKKLRQQKLRLQLYRRQIYESINRKSDVKQISPQPEPEQKLIYERASPKTQTQTQIITKPPVEIPTRTSHRNQIYQRTQTLKNKSRSPIFTPQKYSSNSRSVSPSRVSPFKQKMRSKIFNYDGKTDVNQIRASQRKKYVYQTIAEDLYPRHTYEIGNYNSPHQELQFSRSRGTGNEQVVPLSMRKQVLEQEQYAIKNSANQQKKMKIKVNAAQQSNPQMNNQDKKKIRYLKKSENPMSFRDENAEIEPRRQNTQTGIGNIVMNSPYMKKSPSIRKIPRHQPPPPPASSSSPYLQKSQQKQKPIKQGQEPFNRRNTIYLKEQGQLTETSGTRKGGKQIKGSTYLQKYNKSKNITPEKAPKTQNELRSYNKTIRNFNENNRMYDIIQSPERTDIKNVRNDVSDEDVGGKGSSYRDVTPSKKKYQYVFN